MHETSSKQTRFTTPLAAILMVLTISSVGCSTRHWSLDRSIVSDGAVVVELEGWNDERAPLTPDFSHPATLDVEVVARVLGDLRYDDTGLFARKQKLAPLMTQQRARQLARALIVGFGSAHRDQRLRFTVDTPVRTLGFLPTEETCRGVAFMQPSGTLNLAFDLVGERLRPEEEVLPVWTDPTEGAYSDVELILPEFARTHSSERPLWIQIDLDRVGVISAPMEPTPPTTQAAEPARPASQPTTETVTPPVVQEPKVEPPKAQLTDQEILSRLRQLEELHAEGLISDEAYAKKRKELLAPSQD